MEPASESGPKGPPTSACVEVGRRSAKLDRRDAPYRCATARVRTCTLSECSSIYTRAVEFMYLRAFAPRRRRPHYLVPRDPFFSNSLFGIAELRLLQRVLDLHK